MSLAIGDLEFVAETHAEQLLRSQLPQVDDLQGADDLVYRLVSLGFVLLSSDLSGICHQILEIPNSRFVASNRLSLPRDAQPLGDCSWAFFIGEACFDLVNVGCYRFEGHWTSAWTRIGQLDKIGQNNPIGTTSEAIQQ